MCIVLQFGVEVGEDGCASGSIGGERECVRDDGAVPFGVVGENGSAFGTEMMGYDAGAGEQIGDALSVEGCPSGLGLNVFGEPVEQLKLGANVVQSADFRGRLGGVGRGFVVKFVCGGGGRVVGGDDGGDDGGGGACVLKEFNQIGFGFGFASFNSKLGALSKQFFLGTLIQRCVFHSQQSV